MAMDISKCQLHETTASERCAGPGRPDDMDRRAYMRKMHGLALTCTAKKPGTGMSYQHTLVSCVQCWRRGGWQSHASPVTDTLAPLVGTCHRI